MDELLREFKPLELREGTTSLTTPSATPKELAVGRSFLGVKMVKLLKLRKVYR